MIFWLFFDDFWRFCFKRENQTKPRKSSKNHQKSLKNHQKIIVLLEKPWKSKILASFLGFFQQNDDFLMIFWWFPRFCFSLLKQNLQKSSKKYQKIIVLKNIVLLEKQWKSSFWQVFLVFSSKTMIFWWFPGVLLDFLFWSKTFKIIKKSSKKYHFFIIVFIILKKYHVFIILFVLSGHQPPSYENFFVSKSSWQTCWRWLSQGLNSARLPCT